MLTHPHMVEALVKERSAERLHLAERERLAHQARQLAGRSDSAISFRWRWLGPLWPRLGRRVIT